MLFKRAKAMGFFERLRIMLWPRRSLGRSIRFVVLRMKRLPSSPHRIALGAAMGVFAVFTPFLGAQLLLAAVMSAILRGSIVASALASFFGNPLTYPLIWFSTFNLGKVLLGDAASARLVDLQGKVSALWNSLLNGSPEAIANAADSLMPILKPMIVGSLPLGALAGALTYIGVRRLIVAAHARKLARLSLRAAPQAGS
jgi:uncharacterized protein (DUF2062 family)